MSWPALADARSLAGAKRPPCVSLYVQLRSSFTASLDNARRYGQAVVRAADGLESVGAPSGLVREWAGRLASLERDLRRLGPSCRGVAVFQDVEALRSYRLAAPPAEDVVVGDCFSLRELLRQIELLSDEPGPPPPAEGIVVELDRILAAARRGAVRRLWTREGARLPGRFDPRTGRIGPAAPGEGDVLDGLAASVLRAGGSVFVVRPDDLPGRLHTVAELQPSNSSSDSSGGHT